MLIYKVNQMTVRLAPNGHHNGTTYMRHPTLVGFVVSLSDGLNLLPLIKRRLNDNGCLESFRHRVWGR